MFLKSQAELLENFRRFSEYHPQTYVNEKEIFDADYQTCFELRRLMRNKEFLTENEFLDFIEIFNQLKWKGLELFGEFNTLTQLASYFNYLIKRVDNEFPDRYWKVILIKIDSIETLFNEIKKGRQLFIGFDFTEGYDFENQDLSGVFFFCCYFVANFRKAKLRVTIFVQCNLKTCDFTEAYLDNSTIEECLIDGAKFNNSYINEMVFHKNYIQGAIVNEEYLLDFECTGEPKQSTINI